jgi:hypothetical protein
VRPSSIRRSPSAAWSARPTPSAAPS